MASSVLASPSPEALPALGPAIDLALACDRVQRLVLTAPELALWIPGRARWGIALVGGDRAVLALDGCLDLALARWPRPAPRRVDLVALASRLRGALRLGAIGGERVFAHRLPGSEDGACCVVAALDGLPWLAPDRAPAPPAAVAWPRRVGGAA